MALRIMALIGRGIKMRTTTIKFKLSGIDKEINVKHDLPNIKGLSIEDAFSCWSARTNSFTSKSFAKYIRSKGFKAIEI